MGDGSSEQKTYQVLVVDDEETVRVLAAACIEHGLGPNWQVRFASGGEEALASVAGARPDLILLDILMPGVDGLEVCRRLKASPDTRAIPIIFLTALGDEPSIDEALKLGAASYIIKPFNAVVLAAQVAAVLE
jgi:CheY-like chemotaxis protein